MAREAENIKNKKKNDDLLINVLHGEIYSNDFSQLDQLVMDSSSCVRFCYNRFKKDKSSFNEVRDAAKLQYPTLNTRQISDAVVEGQRIYTRFHDDETNTDQKIIFGSRECFEQRQKHKITKEQWNDCKNKQVYARGDKTKNGNPNIRVVNNSLRITVNHKFVSYPLYVPNRFQEELAWLQVQDKAYNVRVMKKDKCHYTVNIDYSHEVPEAKITLQNGAIGIDVNPDRIAVCVIDKGGNYVKSFSLMNQKLLFASTEKRDYEIALLVKQIIQYAQKMQLGIVFENLDFEKHFDYRKKRNRMKSNFVWRKFITLLERKCKEYGIEYKKVNPAYTSIMGKWKYKNLFNINIHESAAYVIGRRGLGYKEKLSITGYKAKEVKKFVLRTDEAKYKDSRISSWKLWQLLKDNSDTVLTGLSSSTSTPRELDDISKLSLDDLDVLDNEGEILSSEISSRELVTKSRKSGNTEFRGRRKTSKEISDFS